MNSIPLCSGSDTVGALPGCSELAFSYAYDFPEAVDLSKLGDSLRNQIDVAIEGFESSAAGVDALAGWRTCMADSGYEFDRPIDANTRYSEEASISEEEIEVRLADLRCDRSVRLTERRSQFETERRESTVSVNAEAVDEVTRMTTLVTKVIADRTSARCVPTGVKALGG